MQYQVFDTATIFATSIIIDFIIVLILLHTWRTRTTYAGFTIWIAGQACWAVGTTLSILLNEVRPLFVPIIIGNGLVMLYPVLLFEGMNQFYGIRRRWLGTPLKIALVLAGLVLLYHLACGNDSGDAVPG